VLRFICAVTLFGGQIMVWRSTDYGIHINFTPSIGDPGNEHWIGIIVACRILALIGDRFAFYGLIAFAWKSWKCARAGFSRNEMRAVASLVIFTSVADLVWLATEAMNDEALPALIFRTTFYLYTYFACLGQGKAIAAHLAGLQKQEDQLASGDARDSDQQQHNRDWGNELGSKVRKYRTHQYAHRLLAWFIAPFGVYCVVYLGVATQGLLPRVLPVELLEELAYLLLYCFLASCILQRLIH
jgi:hypothetical protein